MSEHEPGGNSDDLSKIGIDSVEIPEDLLPLLRMGAGYPHVVTRYMAAAYGRTPFNWVTGPTDAHKEEGRLRRSFTVECPGEVPQEGVTLSPELVQRAIDVVVRHVMLFRLRCSIVFSPRLCLFVEPDGSLKWSKKPPSGGIQLG